MTLKVKYSVQNRIEAEKEVQEKEEKNYSIDLMLIFMSRTANEIDINQFS